MPVPGVGSLMETTGSSLREALFPDLFVGREFNNGSRYILGHIVKHGGLKNTVPQENSSAGT